MPPRRKKGEVTRHDATPLEVPTFLVDSFGTCSFAYYQEELETKLRLGYSRAEEVEDAPMTKLERPQVILSPRGFKTTVYWQEEKAMLMREGWTELAA